MQVGKHKEFYSVSRYQPDEFILSDSYEMTSLKENKSNLETQINSEDYQAEDKTSLNLKLLFYPQKNTPTNNSGLIIYISAGILCKYPGTEML